MSDYNFRGISQSDRSIAGTFYVEGRANIIPEKLQIYGGIQPWTTKLSDIPDRRVRLLRRHPPDVRSRGLRFRRDLLLLPARDPGLLDPLTGGIGNPLIPGAIPFTKADTDFWEVYGKVTWTVNPIVTLGAYVYYSPDWLNTGADGTFVGGTVKLTAPSAWFPTDFGAYVSAEVDRYLPGTTDAFFGNINLPDYTYWNVGIAFTYKIFTLDLRYHDTDLNRTQCFVLTGDLGGLPGGGGSIARSNWCSEAFIAKPSIDTPIK